MRAFAFAFAFAACVFAAACGPDTEATPDAGVDNGLPTCSGKPITASAALDLDIAVVHTTGRITLAGQPLPVGASGSLEFREDTTRVLLDVPLDAAYDVSLAPGTYTVSFVAPPADSCTGPLPCNTGPFKRGVSLTKDGTLDLDIPVSLVHGKITLNGGDMGAASGGFVAFTVAGGKPLTVRAGALYSTALLPGSYTVDFAGDPTTLCAGPLPCNSGNLKTGVSISGNATVDLDIRAVTLTGNVTLTGGALPVMPQGFLDFSLDNGGKSGKATLQLAPTYSATLLAGTYTIGFGGDVSTQCNGPLPCTGGAIKKSISLSGMRQLDLDIPAVRVSGLVTVDGGVLPTPSSEQLEFVPDGGVPAAIPLTASYSVIVFPGTYTVDFIGAGGGTCAGPLPCNSGPIKTGAAITANGSLALDVKTATVTGTITLSGGQVPPTGGAALTFALAGAPTDPLSELGISGAPVTIMPTYSAKLLQGTYNIGYLAFDSTCAGPFPCNSGELEKNVSITTSTTHNVNIPAVTLTGHVTLAKAPMPTMTLPRGDIGFALNGGTIARSDSLGSSGSAAYNVTILAGHYIVLYDGNSEFCSQATPGSPPCSNEILAGCP